MGRNIVNGDVDTQTVLSAANMLTDSLPVDHVAQGEKLQHAGQNRGFRVRLDLKIVGIRRRVRRGLERLLVRFLV